MFSGSIPALVTPFRGGTFDEAAFRRLVDWQNENGSAALVECSDEAKRAVDEALVLA
ncbi:MAG: 4-hydroxy-tetrahydrodipicolinate synthase, partial [Erythrobacteraceae bacterium]